MAEPLDVAGRLAEGRPSVDNVGDYVWACHLLGYQNPDLTLHAAQVRDWYSSEDGLDLRALEADRAALNAAAQATESARQLQEQQLGALAAAWQGRASEASHDFLQRHGEASAVAASAMRDAADALTALRDDLWHAVDEKVAAAVSIEDRRLAQRPAWLAATQTVTTGAGDRAVASELIDQQVKPFVDNDIRSDWLTAMQKAMAAVAAAFDTATGVLTGEPAAMFEVPGDLGPSSTSATAPAAWSAMSPAAAPAMAPMTASAPAPSFAAVPEPVATPMAAAPPATTPVATAPAMPTMPSLGELGGGMPGAAGGLAGLGTQLADAIGGLLNQPENALPDPPELPESPDELDDKGSKPDEDAEPDTQEPEPDDQEPEPEAEEAAEESATKPVDACTQESVGEEPPVEPTPTPPPAPMPPPPEPFAEPPPSPEPVNAETPCEIAVEELPQAGP